MSSKGLKINFGMLAFILIASSIYFIINYYIGKRTIQRINHVFNINTTIFWVVFWIIALSYVAAKILDPYMPSRITNVFNIIGVYYMAVIFYLLIFFSLLDLVKLFNKRIHFIPNIIMNYNNLSVVISLVTAVIMVLLISLGSFNAKNSYVKNYNINVNKNARSLSSLNIVMVSDIHLGDLIENKRLKKMVSEINELNPDVVIIAGDIVDSSIKPFLDKYMAKEFKNIYSKYGVYAALGNHDLMMGNGDKITQALEEEGNVQVLRDKALLVNESFYIVGRDDISINRVKGTRKPLEEIIRDKDTNLPVIVIDHTPKAIEEANNIHADLMLCGHTHRGQMIPNNLITSKMYEIDHGYLKKKDLNIVVSSGYGTWGPPIRIGSRSEIVNIKLNFKLPN